MRAHIGIFAAAVATLPAPGCSGGYPIAPTACDEWCHITKGEECTDYYSPSGCVSNCEQRGIALELCQPELEAELECFRRNPNANQARCGSYTSQGVPCGQEAIALAACRSPVDEIAKR